MLTNLLIYRFLIFNIAACVGLFFAWDQGYVEYVFDDRTKITFIIAVMFLFVSVQTAREIFRASVDLNNSKMGRWYPDKRTEMKDSAKVSWLMEASDWMVALGLLGTIIGFAVALSGVNEDSLHSAGGVQTSVSHLMSGMKIALNTTIVGAICSLWNSVNQRMLITAKACYWQDRK